MSYGQRRLIELFRAILLKPSLLCLDEPFNYLDEGSRQFVSKILFSPQYLEDIARIVMTTHYESDFLNVRGIEYSLYHFNGKFPYAQLEKRK
jgi:ABC-type molybdenum transport system ATPase subunit/photorepair protein PhrA